MLVMSLLPELAQAEELPRLIFKGRILKLEEVVGSLGIEVTDFVVVALPKKAAAATSSQSTGSQGLVSPATSAAPAAVPAAETVGSPPEEVVAYICGMGFDRPKVLQALQAAFNNPDRAVEYLFGGIPTSTPFPDAFAPATASTQWPEDILGAQLMTRQGLQPTRQALGGATAVALYFSAHWCQPCRDFTPVLTRALSGNACPQLAVVFVSQDQDMAAFTQYFSEMPWLAIPFNSPTRNLVQARFPVRGIPSLIVLDGQMGRQITTTGREDVMRNQYNMQACLQMWGVGPRAAPAPAQTAINDTPPAPQKKALPAPLPIDDVAAEAALARVADETWEVQEGFFKTGLKVLDNAMQNPDEPKFRSLKRSNATLSSKLLAVAFDAGTALLVLAGFEATADGDLLSLSRPPDGRCTAVYQKMEAATTKAWEKHAREERDARIKDEVEKDKSRVSRYKGVEGAGSNKRGPPKGGC